MFLLYNSDQKIIFVLHPDREWNCDLLFSSRCSATEQHCLCGCFSPFGKLSKLANLRWLYIPLMFPIELLVLETKQELLRNLSLWGALVANWLHRSPPVSLDLWWESGLEALAPFLVGGNWRQQVISQMLRVFMGTEEIFLSLKMTLSVLNNLYFGITLFLLNIKMSSPYPT